MATSQQPSQGIPSRSTLLAKMIGSTVALTARLAESPEPDNQPRRLQVRRIDPRSVFGFALTFSLFLGAAIIVASLLLSVVLGQLGVLASINMLLSDVARSPDAVGPGADIVTTGSILIGAGVVAALDVVLLTALATGLALLYNASVSFSGGVEFTVVEPSNDRSPAKARDGDQTVV